MWVLRKECYTYWIPIAEETEIVVACSKTRKLYQMSVMWVGRATSSMLHSRTPVFLQ